MSITATSLRHPAYALRIHRAIRMAVFDSLNRRRGWAFVRTRDGALSMIVCHLRTAVGTPAIQFVDVNNNRNITTMVLRELRAISKEAV